MMKNLTFQLIASFLLLSQFCFAQVDVVYNDLVWSDEFNTNGAVDATKWHHQTQLPNGGSWYNGELQHYTNLTTNSYVDTGLLNIVAKKETFTDQSVTKNYTSARLNSKFAFKYGRIDVRAKLPVEQGTWPAIWMLGKNIIEPGGYYSSTYGTTSWPACGEIDIMEHGIFPSQPINYIQSTLHTTSSSGNSVNNGGVVSSTDLQNNFHIYSMNWSPNQLTFLLDNVPYYTYNPSVKTAANWPFDKEQYLLLNIAMGGIAGNISSSFTQTNMIVDYVRVYQNTTPDGQAPYNFTATVGTITGTSIELLLNATDNSGTINYGINYGSINTSTTGVSNTQKSFIISGLSPNTNYQFSISATDQTGNAAANNPILVNATTLGNVTNGCSGISSDASQGSFSTGYSYNFQTIGSDVKVTIELLDTDKTGVFAYLWKQTPFTETPMTNVTGKIFTSTITGQTMGSTITYAVKFAFAGGLSVTKYINYVVGTNCALSTNELATTKENFYPNPVENILYFQLSEPKNEIEIFDVSGKKLWEEKTNFNGQIDMSNYKKGIYLLSIKNKKEKKVFKIIKK